MPPKARITKEDIINAGLGVIRRSGQESLNVRAVAAYLGCSTQPVMYHYKTVEALKSDIYAAADKLHSEFIMSFPENENAALALGINYIRFAAEEKELFRFLFQSDKFDSGHIEDLFSADELKPMLETIAKEAQITGGQLKELFRRLFICVHGLSSLLANNSVEYDAEYGRRLLSGIFLSSLEYMRTGKDMEQL